MTKLSAITSQFSEALQRLNEVLVKPKDEFMRDSAIQRFEFTLDLSWKAVKTYLEEKSGIVCNAPKQCFREAYQQGLIKYDDKWLLLVDMRNETVHTYKEEVADKIYGALPDAVKLFEALLGALQK